LFESHPASLFYNKCAVAEYMEIVVLS